MAASLSNRRKSWDGIVQEGFEGLKQKLSEAGYPVELDLPELATTNKIKERRNITPSEWLQNPVQARLGSRVGGRFHHIQNIAELNVNDALKATGYTDHQTFKTDVRAAVELACEQLTPGEKTITEEAALKLMRQGIEQLNKSRQGWGQKINTSESPQAKFISRLIGKGLAPHTLNILIDTLVNPLEGPDNGLGTVSELRPKRTV